jgi:uncharacterized protein (DUF608 family)
MNSPPDQTRERTANALRVIQHDHGIACCSTSGDPFRLLERRGFLKLAGVGAVSSLAGFNGTIMAGDFSAEDLNHGMLIPPEKKLDPAWVRGLYARGNKEVFSGEALQSIGMPCGGIGAGQLYLCGDGTLADWKVFNEIEDGWGGPFHTINRKQEFDRPLEQGFALVLSSGEGLEEVYPFSTKGFSEIAFKGECPIATVTYSEKNVPVKVDMEVFSPFIPLNAKDSALPATTIHFKLRNISDKHARISIVGWLENAVARSVGGSLPGRRVTSVLDDKRYRTVLHAAKATRQKTTGETIVFEDFEYSNFNDWQVVGEAFGEGPVSGTASNQGGVTGFQGEKLANSYARGDRPKGKLISKPFTIDKPFINLLVGGGGHRDETCVNLVVGGKILRTATGRNVEHLSWRSWDVTELKDAEATIEAVDQNSVDWGHVLVDQIEFSDSPRMGKDERFEKSRDFGTMALACSAPFEGTDTDEIALPNIAGDQVVNAGSKSCSMEDKLYGAIRSREFEIAPGGEQEVTFVVAWHFPNAKHGNFYATRFGDASQVVEYLIENHERLAGDTRLWRDVYYDSTLPYWLLDRLMSTVSTLATGTCQWWANGRFYAYEGVGCCPGTCTHVWNYAQADGRLFPELSRSVRELQDLNPRESGGGFHPDSGLVGFRSDDSYAADGQCGTVLKAYRDHQTSPDNSFLYRFWSRIKSALQYSIQQDANSDGLIENSQHNTYDINYEGANTFVGSLYLAALRAGEEMATEVGDVAFANHCRAIYESGGKLTQRRLWNGEFFAQEVDMQKYPQHQYGPGCLSDQLFGQGWAHQLGLGYLYPQEMVASALAAVWKYNWALDISSYNEVHKPFRWFVAPGQSGLFICTWPHSEYLPEGTLYKNEVWTGIEYQVAGHMIAEGMLTEGLAMCRAIHDRYQPSFFNPYNEIECGDHYARALASWGVLLALSGFSYHGPKGRLGFSPKITPEHFKAVFTAAEGWGSFEQTRTEQVQTAILTVRWGRLRLKELTFTLPQEGAPHSTTVSSNGKPVEAELTSTGRDVTLTFADRLTLNRDESLKISFRM